MAARNGTRTGLWHEAVPRLAIPEIGVSEGRYGAVVFQIPTRRGLIAVSSSSHDDGTATWECVGCTEALVEHGLLNPAWLPGLPGNNKMRQSILFEHDGAQLIHGNRRGRKFNGEIATVVRKSKDTFVVEIPATHEQARRIRAQHLEWRERDFQTTAAIRAERVKQHTVAQQKKLSADDVRFQIGGVVSQAHALLMRAIEHSAYRIDLSTEAEIDERFRQIQVLINRAVLKPKAAMVKDGNVVYLKR